MDDLIKLVNGLIGKPYESGAMGPDKFDCWGLVRHVQINGFNRNSQIIVPPDTDNIRDLVKFIRDHKERDNWKAVDRPIHGGIVEMSNSQNPHHIGIYLDVDGGGILHCSIAGVCFESIFNLKISGWRNMVYYTYVGS